MAWPGIALSLPNDLIRPFFSYTLCVTCYGIMYDMIVCVCKCLKSNFYLCWLVGCLVDSLGDPFQ